LAAHAIICATGVQPVQPEEIDMGKQNGVVSIREAVEKVFAGVASAVIVAFIATGTIAMCLPAIPAV
jgi:hypothetical protein